ncbi:MAG: tetraacyldisaccharide 4'-kinase [Deltaproteobacteria bacterium]|nr:tetraacyldisaccharide 4'-kinase [Deltaproteobacteria bacterium]
MHPQYVQHLIERLWRRQNFWHRLGWLALTPASVGFTALVRGRNLLYNRGHFPTTQVPLNVVSVGNLTVGGTGKTPMTLWLAQALQARGYRVGILTRGYKGTKTDFTVVGTAGKPLVTPEEVGDEAVMMVRRFSGVVIAGRDRMAAAVRAHHEFDLDVAILDDGFQHRQLHRDVDILLVSAQANDNQWVLPAGPFREPVTAARRADVLVLTKRPMEDAQTPTFPLLGIDAVSVFSGDLVPTAFVNVDNRGWYQRSLAAVAEQRVLALTGIAAPASFYRMLHEWDAIITEVLEFPDHHHYTHADWQHISQLSQKCDLIVTTEKDLVKLERFPFATGRLLALRVDMHVEPAAPFLDAIEQRFRYRKKEAHTYGSTLSDSGGH